MRKWNHSSHHKKIRNVLLTSPRRMKGLLRSVSGMSMLSRVVNIIRCLRIPKFSTQIVMYMLLGNTSNTLTCNISTIGCNHLLLISGCAWIPIWRNLYNKCIPTMPTTMVLATTSLRLVRHKTTIRNSTKSNICQIPMSSHQIWKISVAKNVLIKLKPLVAAILLKVRSWKLKNH